MRHRPGAIANLLSRITGEAIVVHDVVFLIVTRMLPRPEYRARLREEANLDVVWTLVQDMKFDIFGVCLRHERNKNRRNKKNSPNNVFHQWLLILLSQKV